MCQVRDMSDSAALTVFFFYSDSQAIKSIKNILFCTITLFTAFLSDLEYSASISLQWLLPQITLHFRQAQNLVMAELKA